MKSSKLLLAVGTWILGISFSNAATCTATGSGDWYNPSIWSCGVVPGCGDLVTIPAGIVVNVDEHVMIDESSMPACTSPAYIQVYGTLRFVTGKKMELACGSAVEIMVGGLLQNGGGGGSSNWLKICGVTEWQSSDGNVPGYHLFGSPIPLPATLLSFETMNTPAGVYVGWVLASERSVNYYRVDFSENGVEWTTVADVPSRGDHTSTTEYGVSVPAQPVEIGYFRLTSIDEDGTNQELSVNSHQFAASASVYVYPNPVNQDAAFYLNSQFRLESALHFEVSDLNGRIMRRGEISVEQSSVSIETVGWEQGVYLVRFADERLQSMRVVVR